MTITIILFIFLGFNNRYLIYVCSSFSCYTINIYPFSVQLIACLVEQKFKDKNSFTASKLHFHLLLQLTVLSRSAIVV